ncbi:universal stress protein [Nocardia asteroides]|uniref:universal stress protein n=1 Tax=Nocardia asteroides TaxID=1824 RepID=UPI001E518C65|nr:universal stress protein [Nocardia asteroides]UGT58925.1 universal stress protein [Nocardia asteroides]
MTTHRRSWLHHLTTLVHTQTAPAPPARRRAHASIGGATGTPVRPYRTILVDTDTDTERALDRAVDLARATGARLLITCVHHPDDPRALGPDLDRLHPDDYRLRGTTPTDTVLAAARARASARGAPAVETHRLTEPALDAIMALARNHHADLIVIGEPALRTRAARVAGHFLDTPAIGLVRHAPCDILIVPTR